MIKEKEKELSQHHHDKQEEDHGKFHQDHSEIKNKIDKCYDIMISELKKNRVDTERIEEIIVNINNSNRDTVIEVGQEIMGHINWAFEEYGKDFDESLQEVYANLKQSDNWTTKLQLSIPLLDLLGINIKHELKLNKFIKWIHNTF